MLTGQKYGEGDSHANNVDSAVSNPEQTGENSPQTATDTPPAATTAEPTPPANESFSFGYLKTFAGLSQPDKQLLIDLHKKGLGADERLLPPLEEQGPFQFDDLLLYNELNTGRKWLVDWIASKGFSDDQLKLALDWLSKAPDTASPFDKVEGMSLPDILGGAVNIPKMPASTSLDSNPSKRTRPEVEAELTAILSDRMVEIGGVFSFKGRTYVRLPDYLEEALSTEEKTEACRTEVRKAFTGYMLSGKFLALNDPEKTKKATDLMVAISMFMARVDRHREPKSLRTNITTEDILENPFNPEFHEAIMLESSSIREVDMLQEWVERLQKIVTIQMEINHNLNQLVDPRSELIQVMKTTLLEHEATIARLQQEAKGAALATNYDVPKTAHYLDLTLYTDGEIESEVELVRQALADYRDSVGIKVLELIVNGETSEAHYHTEEQARANAILDRLTQALIDLASNGYKVSRYMQDPSGFLHTVDVQRAYDRQVYAEFKKKYSTRYNVEEEETTENTGEKSQETPQAAE